MLEKARKLHGKRSFSCSKEPSSEHQKAIFEKAKGGL